MKQVIRAYGAFLLDGIILILLLMIIFNGITDDEGNIGVAAMIGAGLEIEGADYNTYTDFRVAYQTESNKDKPEISYSGSSLSMGVNKLADYITALDYSGRQLALKVTSITSPEGLELIDTYNQETSEINLPQPGIYIVTVNARDDINRFSECMIRIPVNK